MKKLALLAIFAVTAVFASAQTVAPPQTVTVSVNVLQSATLSLDTAAVTLTADPQDAGAVNSFAEVTATYSTNFASSLDLTIPNQTGFTYSALWESNGLGSIATVPTNSAGPKFKIHVVANNYLTVAGSHPSNTVCTVTLSGQ